MHFRDQYETTNSSVLTIVSFKIILFYICIHPFSGKLIMNLWIRIKAVMTEQWI